MADVLIERATVITMDAARRVIEDGAVAIESDRIVAVGKSDEVRAQHAAPRVIDGYRKLVIPGLVDLYAHSGAGIAKALGEQLGVGWWPLMDDLLFSYATPRWFYVDSQLHAIERLRFGCTTILSQPGLSHARVDDPIYAQQTQRAFEDLGIRARVIASIPRSSPWRKTYADFVDGRRIEKGVGPEQCFEVIEQLIGDSKRHPSPLVDYCTGAFIIGNPSLVDAEHPENPFYGDQDIGYYRKQGERLRSIMERYDVGFWAHAWGDAIEHAYDEGFRDLLTPRTVLSHCTRLNDRSIQILAETGTNVNHCPRARRLQIWHETCRVVEMLEAGVNVGLGSDAPQVDRTGDVFMDMQMVMKVQRRRVTDPSVLPAGKLLEMVTVDSQRALGLDQVTGSLEPGKKADVVVVDAFRPHLWPLSMPVQQLVYYGTGHDVEHVFVDGRHVVEQGRVTTVDQAALLEEAAQELERLMGYPELGLRALTELPERFWRHVR